MSLLNGQDSNKTKAQYQIDEQSGIDISTLSSGKLNLSGMSIDRTVVIADIGAKQLELPFLGKIYTNDQQEIVSLDVKDPLLKYGSKKVTLTNPIGILKTESGEQSSQYSISLSPDELLESSRRQLPILPDSVRINISIKFLDSELQELDVISEEEEVSARYFSRKYVIDRTVEIKIAPFGWESVNDIAPMIDWDNTSEILHYYILDQNSKLPFLIINQSKDGSSIAYLEQNASIDVNSLNVGGYPSIMAIPNPVISDVRFEVANLNVGSYTIKIKNILGELKARRSFEYASVDYIPMDIKHLRKGSYFYVLEDAEGNVISTKRLIVLRP